MEFSKKTLWELFAATGNIGFYLLYRKLREGSE